jgi:L-ribulose-5-phosphate 3-epimerase
VKAADQRITERIGFMQGRLSALVDGKIQAFPWNEWREEFPRAKAIGLSRMEWTIDQERLRENPLTTESGRGAISRLSRGNAVEIPSLTGDCFMQAPFWKADGQAREALIADLDLVLASCAALRIVFVVIPLVDNGKIESPEQAEVLLRVLLDRSAALSRHGTRIVFESDLPPTELAQFIARFPQELFGINYDIGNSAALGFDCGEEIAAYAPRILNVHIKDRLRGGTTVPLGSGAAELAKAIRLIENSGYSGQYVLQTARAADGDHAAALARYLDMAKQWIGEAGR